MATARTVHKPDDVPATGHYQLITFETVSVDTGYPDTDSRQTFPVIKVYSDITLLNDDVRAIVLQDSKAPFIVQRVTGRATVEAKVAVEFKP